MAPSRITHPKSVVENVADRLPDKEKVKINEEFIRSTEEDLRKLETRVGVGKLGRGDSSESRAAILLNRKLRLGMEKLAKTCGTSKKDINTLSTKVENYMGSYDASSRKQHYRGQQPNTDPLSRTLPPAKQESIITHLSIRLGSLIPDSHGFAKRTEKLLDDMQHHIQRSKGKKKHDYLEDIRRHRKKYEAVCFYILAEENQLTKEDDINETLLEASGVNEKDFKSVYAQAKTFHSEMKKIQENANKRARVPESQPPKGRPGKKKKSTSNKTATELLGLVASGNAIMLHSEAQGSPQLNRRFVYSKSFESWKAKTLEEAMKNAREGEEELSDSQALHKAADLILAKHSELANFDS